MRLAQSALPFSTTRPNSRCADGVHRVRFSLPVTVGTAAALALLLATTSLRAETVFLGPTPYLSQADSPFDLSGLGETFFLEDFEDGEFNAPGILQVPPPGILNETAIGVILPPGEFTNSVDGDAGGIDGSGSDGRSLRSTHVVDFLSLPPLRVMTMGFAIEPNVLGLYPEGFGFVWTDGIPNSVLSLTIIDPTGNSQNMRWDGLGDETLSNTTADDRFMGVVHGTGISQVWVTSLFHGFTDIESFQIDHLQYGHVIPEPTGRTIFLMSALLAISLLLKTEQMKFAKSRNQQSYSLKGMHKG